MRANTPLAEGIQRRIPYLGVSATRIQNPAISLPSLDGTVHISAPFDPNGVRRAAYNSDWKLPIEQHISKTVHVTRCVVMLELIFTNRNMRRKVGAQHSGGASGKSVGAHAAAREACNGRANTVRRLTIKIILEYEFIIRLAHLQTADSPGPQGFRLTPRPFRLLPQLPPPPPGERCAPQRRGKN